MRLDGTAVKPRGITAVQGVKLGHYTNEQAVTGCTVVLCESGAVGGVDVRGSAPGTRETDLLRPMNLVSEVHGVLLSGGSAFGLEAAAGVVLYLDERGIGYDARGVTVPIVPGAVLFDLAVGDSSVRPGADQGYEACRNATSAPVAEGSVGAGTGATVGKLLGIGQASKGGTGSVSLDLGDGLVVGAVVAVNALGDVYDPETGEQLAGPRQESGNGFYSSIDLLTRPGAPGAPAISDNTTIGVVATNATLTKEQANKLASVAHDGIALAVRPAHTMSDGDTIFALGTGRLKGDVDMLRLGAAAVQCVSAAIVRGVTMARSLGGVPSVMELRVETSGE